MINELLMRILNPALDGAVSNTLTKDYPQNMFLMATIAEKLTLPAMIEAGMRAETGQVLSRPIGSPISLSPWEKILFNPKQLFQLPTADLQNISTKTVIGPGAKKPLRLDIPIMITAMSYGGSLSLPMKMALAKGAAMVGTSTNTGESTVTNEERDSARFLIGQYNRGGWLTSPESLERVDAIEVQFGQGAFGGAVDTSVKSKDIGEHLQKAWHTEDGEDATVYGRMPQVNSTDDIIKLINSLKERYSVPVGIKIAGSDYIEYELEVIARTEADFISIDGAEGGTAAAPPTLEDNSGLPTLHSLVRTINWLHDNKIREKFSVIIAGGLKTPGDFLKAMALGADAVYIGSIALIAAMQSQMTKAVPDTPPVQLAIYTGTLTDELDVDLAAKHLYNFLTSCTEEMKLLIQAIGKKSTKELDRSDLVTVDKELAEFMRIRYAAESRESVSRNYNAYKGGEDYNFIQ